MQHKIPADSADKCPDNALFVASPETHSKGNCYSYEVAEAVCILLTFSVDAERATYDWEFLGGCFPDNKLVKYTTATPGQTYDFNDIPLQIREYKKGLAEKVASGSSLHNLFWLLSSLAMISAILVLILLIVTHFKQDGSKTNEVQMGETSGRNYGRHGQFADEE